MVEPAVSPAALNNPNPTLSAAPKDRRQYTCLCGQMHLLTAVRLIGLLEAIGIVVALICVIVKYAQGEQPLGSLIGVLIAACVWAMALVCLFMAIQRQKPTLLLTHLAVQVCSTVGLLALAVVLSVAIISEALKHTGHLQLPLLGVLISVLAGTALNTWFTIVVAKYYHFLRGQL